MDNNKLKKIYFRKWHIIINVIIYDEIKNKNWEACNKFCFNIKSYKRAIAEIASFPLF